MSDKKKFDEDQMWSTIMPVVAVVILMNAGAKITDDNTMRLILSGAFGALGGIIGMLGLYISKNQSRLIKIITTILIFLISLTSVEVIGNYYNPVLTDSEILEKDWITQKIGKLDFSTPKKLTLLTEKIPPALENYYEAIKVFSDKDDTRLTTFNQYRLFVDTLSVDDVYLGTLEGMLNNLKVDFETVELEVLESTEKVMVADFSFSLKDERMNGYGFMHKEKDTFDSIWLIPITRGFSVEYIEEFDLNIFTEEE